MTQAAKTVFLLFFYYYFFVCLHASCLSQPHSFQWACLCVRNMLEMWIQNKKNCKTAKCKVIPGIMGRTNALMFARCMGVPLLALLCVCKGAPEWCAMWESVQFCLRSHNALVWTTPYNLVQDFFLWNSLSLLNVPSI